MFRVGDKICYATTGICEIIGETTQEFGAKKRDYYVLLCLDKQANRILVPKDNPKLLDKMKPIPKKSELEKLLRLAKENILPFEEDDNLRKEMFLGIISRAQAEELLPLFACVVLHKREAEAVNRRLKANDGVILKTVERVLSSQIAAVFSVDIAEAEKMLYKAVE